MIELINGMQEIKLHNAEKRKRWNWEFLQVRLLKLSIESLSLEQWQSVGSNFINELKNIMITVMAAKLVIDGALTLGMMLAITYIVGQLNAPVTRLIGFIRELQDAKISLDRLAEIHDKEDEIQTDFQKLNELPGNPSLNLKNLHFKYDGTENPVLNELNLTIPLNKTTAIVGGSGSGKTTLMKLLLKFYKAQNGEIRVGNMDLENISQSAWRE